MFTKEIHNSVFKAGGVIGNVIKYKHVRAWDELPSIIFVGGQVELIT